MHYIKQKREKVDYCNICGSFQTLTWDHVPPKSTLLEPDTISNTIFKGMPTESKHMKHYQSGIKYRTVCANCNNVVLGQNDDAYKEFVLEVRKQLAEIPSKYLETGESQNTIVVKAKINRVLRSICGHFLAMKEFYDSETVTDRQLREYVLDTGSRLESFEEVNLFCWFYPYPTVFSFRDIVVTGGQELSHPKGFISGISSYPLGYLLSSIDESGCYVDNLGVYSTTIIDEEVQICLHLNTVYYANTMLAKELNWPANISSGQLGAQAALASNRIIEGARLGVPKKKGIWV